MNSLNGSYFSSLCCIDKKCAEKVSTVSQVGERFLLPQN